MTVKTACPHCRQNYVLGDAQVGQTVRCKSCDEPFVVRDSGARGQEAEAVTPRPASGKRPRPPDEPDDRPPPRRSRKTRGGVPLWVWLVGGGVLVLFLACLGGGGLVYWLATGPMRSKVTPENAERIQNGMTEAEVKAILGEPTEDAGLGPALNPLAQRVLTWRNGNNYIVLTLRNGKVAGKMTQFINVKRGK